MAVATYQLTAAQLQEREWICQGLITELEMEAPTREGNLRIRELAALADFYYERGEIAKQAEYMQQQVSDSIGGLFRCEGVLGPIERYASRSRTIDPWA